MKTFQVCTGCVSACSTLSAIKIHLDYTGVLFFVCFFVFPISGSFALTINRDSNRICLLCYKNEEMSFAMQRNNNEFELLLICKVAAYQLKGTAPSRMIGAGMKA